MPESSLTEPGAQSADAQSNPRPEACGEEANKYQTPPFLVAAVGASAGGLEAFSALVHNLPAQAPLALMLVQHLARDQHSLLPEILSKRTALTVVEARDHQRVERGHVYIISPGTQMTVIDGHLRIRPRPEGPGGSQVDTLFHSLAQFYREKAVGIVLSGGAQDGTAGLREIKAAGGITMAQSPDEAQIDSMPKAAIAAGVVDLVLPMDAIAAELLRLAALPMFREPSVAPPSEDFSEPQPPSDREQELRPLLVLLRRATGIEFSQYKRPTLWRRIARRMALRRVESIDDYLRLVQQEPQELQSLSEDLLIHVTSFFREPPSFAALAESVLPTLINDALEEGLRVWVPACSTGEEVYSVAISLMEVLGDDASRVPVQIFGTDVSEVSVARARMGLYTEQIAADVSPERLQRFFTRTEGGYRIGKAIRDRCVFARQDLTRDPPFSRIDLIVCRNLLIYLGQLAQAKGINVMHYALKASGFLMLGRAETPGASADLLTVFDKRFKIYKKKPQERSRTLDFVRAEAEPVPAPSAQPARQRVVPREWDVQLQASRLLLDRYAPPGIVVDDDFQITRVCGHTSAFLELPSGAASLDALSLVRESLLFALRTGLQEARATRAPVRKEGLHAAGAGEGSPISIEITPFGRRDDAHYLVLFQQSEQAAEGRGTPPEGGASSETLRERTIVQLRSELAGTRDQLRANIDDLAAANEELQSANEEILSSNEELQSTNEELDTAKEELQSTNEELNTLNEELHCRNDELTLANADLGNLLASVQIPIVMVTRDLRIRRFTPAAEKMLNLIQSDVGRPIVHINPNFKHAALEPLISQVIATGTVREQVVEDPDGKPYELRIRPYRNSEDRVDGAVLTLFDMPGLSDLLRVAQETGEAIMSTVRDPILLLAPDLKIIRANQAFCEHFATSPAELEGRLVHEIDEHRWDIPELRHLLDTVLPEQENFQSLVVDHRAVGGLRRKFLLDGRRIGPGRAKGGVVLLVIRPEPADAG